MTVLSLPISLMLLIILWSPLSFALEQQDPSVFYISCLVLALIPMITVIYGVIPYFKSGGYRITPWTIHIKISSLIIIVIMIYVVIVGLDKIFHYEENLKYFWALPTLMTIHDLIFFWPFRNKKLKV